MSDEIVAVTKVDVPDIITQPSKLAADLRKQQLKEKVSQFADTSKRELKGTLDRAFDVYESPNVFQVFWVITLLVTLGIFVLSAFLTVDNRNTYVIILSSIATTLLFVGLIGYIFYIPKSLPTFKEMTKKIEIEKYPGAVDTQAAFANDFAQDE